MWQLHLTDRARLDIREVVAWTESNLGQEAAVRYAALIEQSLQDLRLDATRAGIHPIPKVGDEVYVYRVEFSRKNVSREKGRVKRARHLVVFRLLANHILDVVRVVHETRNLSHDETLEEHNN